MGMIRHVIGCHATQETRVQNALDDVTRALSARPLTEVVPEATAAETIDLVLEKTHMAGTDG
jgi:hypothetical protein